MVPDGSGLCFCHEGSLPNFNFIFENLTLPCYILNNSGNSKTRKKIIKFVHLMSGGTEISVNYPKIPEK
jgi:hypothetical protein